MTSTLKLSGNDESNEVIFTDLLPLPQNPGPDWDNLRALTENAYQKRRRPKAWGALLVTLFMAALGTSGFLFRNHIPALVKIGEEISDTLTTLASSTPKPSTPTHETAVADVGKPHSTRRAYAAQVLDSNGDQAYDPAAHPFFATAVIGERRISLVPNNNIIVVDVATGTWKLRSEAE